MKKHCISMVLLGIPFPSLFASVPYARPARLHRFKEEGISKSVSSFKGAYFFNRSSFLSGFSLLSDPLSHLPSLHFRSDVLQGSLSLMDHVSCPAALHKLPTIFFCHLPRFARRVSFYACCEWQGRLFSGEKMVPWVLGSTWHFSRSLTFSFFQTVLGRGSNVLSLTWEMNQKFRNRLSQIDFGQLVQSAKGKNKRNRQPLPPTPTEKGAIQRSAGKVKGAELDGEEGFTPVDEQELLREKEEYDWSFYGDESVAQKYAEFYYEFFKDGSDKEIEAFFSGPYTLFDKKTVLHHATKFLKGEQIAQVILCLTRSFTSKELKEVLTYTSRNKSSLLHAAALNPDLGVLRQIADFVFEEIGNQAAELLPGLVLAQNRFQCTFLHCYGQTTGEQDSPERLIDLLTHLKDKLKLIGQPKLFGLLVERIAGWEGTFLDKFIHYTSRNFETTLNHLFSSAIIEEMIANDASCAFHNSFLFLTINRQSVAKIDCVLMKLQGALKDPKALASFLTKRLKIVRDPTTGKEKLFYVQDPVNGSAQAMVMDPHRNFLHYFAENHEGSEVIKLLQCLQKRLSEEAFSEFLKAQDSNGGNFLCSFIRSGASSYKKRGTDSLKSFLGALLKLLNKQEGLFQTLMTTQDRMHHDFWSKLSLGYGIGTVSKLSTFLLSSAPCTTENKASCSIARSLPSVETFISKRLGLENPTNKPLLKAPDAEVKEFINCLREKGWLQEFLYGERASKDTVLDRLIRPLDYQALPEGQVLDAAHLEALTAFKGFLRSIEVSLVDVIPSRVVGTGQETFLHRAAKQLLPNSFKELFSILFTEEDAADSDKLRALLCAPDEQGDSFLHCQARQLGRFQTKKEKGCVDLEALREAIDLLSKLSPQSVRELLLLKNHDHQNFLGGFSPSFFKIKRVRGGRGLDAPLKLLLESCQSALGERYPSLFFEKEGAVSLLSAVSGPPKGEELYLERLEIALDFITYLTEEEKGPAKCPIKPSREEGRSIFLGLFEVAQRKECLRASNFKSILEKFRKVFPDLKEFFSMEVNGQPFLRRFFENFTWHEDSENRINLFKEVVDSLLGSAPTDPPKAGVSSILHFAAKGFLKQKSLQPLIVCLKQLKAKRMLSEAWLLQKDEKGLTFVELTLTCKEDSRFGEVLGTLIALLSPGQFKSCCLTPGIYNSALKRRLFDSEGVFKPEEGCRLIQRLSTIFSAFSASAGKGTEVPSELFLNPLEEGGTLLHLVSQAYAWCRFKTDLEVPNVRKEVDDTNSEPVHKDMVQLFLALGHVGKLKGLLNVEDRARETFLDVLVRHLQYQAIASSEAAGRLFKLLPVELRLEAGFSDIQKLPFLLKLLEKQIPYEEDPEGRKLLSQLFSKGNDKGKNFFHSYNINLPQIYVAFLSAHFKHYLDRHQGVEKRATNATSFPARTELVGEAIKAVERNGRQSKDPFKGFFLGRDEEGNTFLHQFAEKCKLRDLFLNLALFVTVLSPYEELFPTVFVRNNLGRSFLDVAVLRMHKPDGIFNKNNDFPEKSLYGRLHSPAPVDEIIECVNRTFKREAGSEFVFYRRGGKVKHHEIPVTEGAPGKQLSIPPGSEFFELVNKCYESFAWKAVDLFFSEKYSSSLLHTALERKDEPIEVSILLLSYFDWAIDNFANHQDEDTTDRLKERFLFQKNAAGKTFLQAIEQAADKEKLLRFNYFLKLRWVFNSHEFNELAARFGDLFLVHFLAKGLDKGSVEWEKFKSASEKISDSLAEINQIEYDIFEKSRGSKVEEGALIELRNRKEELEKSLPKLSSLLSEDLSVALKPHEAAFRSLLKHANNLVLKGKNLKEKEGVLLFNGGSPSQEEVIALMDLGYKGELRFFLYEFKLAVYDLFLDLFDEGSIGIYKINPQRIFSLLKKKQFTDEEAAHISLFSLLINHEPNFIYFSNLAHEKYLKAVSECGDPLAVINRSESRVGQAYCEKLSHDSRELKVAMENLRERYFEAETEAAVRSKYRRYFLSLKKKFDKTMVLLVEVVGWVEEIRTHFLEQYKLYPSTSLKIGKVKRELSEKIEKTKKRITQLFRAIKLPGRENIPSNPLCKETEIDKEAYADQILASIMREFEQSDSLLYSSVTRRPAEETSSNKEVEKINHGYSLSKGIDFHKLEANLKNSLPNLNRADSHEKRKTETEVWEFYRGALDKAVEALKAVVSGLEQETKKLEALLCTLKRNEERALSSTSLGYRIFDTSFLSEAYWGRFSESHQTSQQGIEALRRTLIQTTETGKFFDGKEGS